MLPERCCRQHFLGMRPGLGGDLQAAEHPRRFFHAFCGIEFLHRGAGLAAHGLLAHGEMLAGLRRHLRQMRDAQDLAIPAELAQFAADDFSDRAAHPGIDLVEDQRRRSVRSGGPHLYRKIEP